jgi:uncharacterized protein
MEACKKAESAQNHPQIHVQTLKNNGMKRRAPTCLMTFRILPAAALLLLGLPPASFGQAEPPAQRSGSVLRAAAYGEVTLTGGPMADQAQFSRDFYLGISDDNLLNGFRRRAGLPAPGRAMGGWYDPEDFAGAHSFGQWVSALARTYAATGDPRFKDKVASLVHGFHETMAPDGFFFSSLKVSTNWPCYLYDKNCIGMRDAYTLTGNNEALVVLKSMTDWAASHLPRRNDEWYTLPENFYNCYALTKDKRYSEMAREYDYSKEYYNPFADGINAFTPERHAYSHINSLCSAARAYEATGDEKYFKAVSNAWEYLTKTQMYASGGWGPNEHFVPAGQGKLAAALDLTTFHVQTSSQAYGNDFETPCGCYANVNLDRYLLRFTGNPKYGDNMERVLFNGMLAALPMQPDGRTFYYSDYHAGAHKQYFPWLWPCCSGTYALITSDYPLDIYFHDDHGLYVNLFTPSRVQWRHQGRTITVEQTTGFPLSDAALFTVHTQHPAQFTLNIRHPGWTAAPVKLAVNGRHEDVASVPGTFLAINRTWNDGDTVSATFPMSLRFEPLDAQTPRLAALMYGPLLLVALADGDVTLEGDPAKPEQWLQPADPATLTFRTQDSHVVFRPFYQLREERYTTYCHLASPPVQPSPR